MTYSIDWLKHKFDKGEVIKFIFFWGHTNKTNEAVGKFVFSQWFYSPFTVEGIEYKTTEHWMMCHKAKLFGDNEVFEKILKAEKPGEVKELGRQIINFDQPKWDATKYEIVKTGNVHKFQQNKILSEYLINTGDRVIVEASPTDTIWGIGLAADSRLAENPHTWRGENLLGFALMETRDFLSRQVAK
jgi:ribA/ribD-fused uncharacterized protein